MNNEARSTFPLPASANEDVFRLKEETSEPSPYKFQKGKTSDSFNYLRKYFVILAVVVYLIVAQGGNKLPSKVSLIIQYNILDAFLLDNGDYFGE